MATALALLPTAGALTDLPLAHAEATIVNGCVDSVPEPGTSASVPICYTLYRPATASAETPVPVIFESHGWGGSRTNSVGAFGSLLNAGFGVLSFDQRGFGASGGLAHIENPDFEGQDVGRLIDLVATLDWVAMESPGDPVLGAIGGSYGGGYQFVGAFTDLRDRGVTRFDALAPEITWWDLNESLAPAGVARTEWALLLYIAGLPAGAHTQTVTQAVVESALAGNWPARLATFFEQNGPAWHVANGRQLDVPVLFGQGITDNLFPLDQALKTFQHALTPAARARSMVIGYNGGHVLPTLLPLSVGTSGDPCSQALSGGGFDAVRLRFFQEELLATPTGLEGRGQYHLATPAGRCVTVGTTEADTDFPLGDIFSTTGVGLPLVYPIAHGPLTIAGTPTLDAKVTSLGLDGRLFFALSVGTNLLDARVVGNNVLPLREPAMVSDQHRTVELPSMAIDVPAGQTLFLTVTPLSDTFFGHGSRLPGAITLRDTVVRLPVVEADLAPTGPATVVSATGADPTDQAAVAVPGSEQPQAPLAATPTPTAPTESLAPAAAAGGDRLASTSPASATRRGRQDRPPLPLLPVGVAVVAVLVSWTLTLGRIRPRRR